MKIQPNKQITTNYNLTYREDQLQSVSQLNSNWINHPKILEPLRKKAAFNPARKRN